MRKVVRQAKLLRLPAVLERVPYSRSSLYQMVIEKRFPAPHQIGLRAVAWLEEDIDEWIAARIKPGSSAPRPPISARTKVAAAADQQSA